MWGATPVSVCPAPGVTEMRKSLLPGACLGATLVGEAFQPSGGAHGHDHDGEEHGHAHALTSNGFNFREAEIAFSATVDPYFDASLYLAIDGDGNVDLEEGYFQTRNLPYGLKVKGGKFLSDFGYINKQHPHQWDFVDQNLAYGTAR